MTNILEKYIKIEQKAKTYRVNGEVIQILRENLDYNIFDIFNIKYPITSFYNLMNTIDYYNTYDKDNLKILHMHNINYNSYDHKFKEN